MKGKGALTATILAGLAGLVIAADPLATSNSTTIGSQDSSISKAFELLQPLINTAPECSKKCLADIKGLDNVGSLTVESVKSLCETIVSDYYLNLKTCLFNSHPIFGLHAFLVLFSIF